MTEIQFLCFRDWCKFKTGSGKYQPTGLDEVFLGLCKQEGSNAYSFIKGWEMGRGKETGLLK